MPSHQHPTVEDADDSYDEQIHGSKNKPNAAAKRASQSSDLGRDGPRADLASDSGYSSRTAATKSSADSAKSSSNKRGSPVKSQAPPAAPDAPSAAPRPRPKLDTKRKSTHGSESRKSSKPVVQQRSSKERSSTKERTGSSSRPRRDSKPVVMDCTDPNCDKCEPRHKGVRPSPLDTRLNIDYEPFTSPQSPRTPSSPRRVRYTDNLPQIQTQVAGPRPRVYSQGRPTSYHHGSALSDRYSSYGPTGPTFSGGGPPPAMFNHPHYPMMGATPPGGYFGPQTPSSPLASSFDNRPGMTRGASEGYGRTAVVLQKPQQSERRTLPNPRYGPTNSAAISYQQQYDKGYYSEEEEDGYYRSPEYEQARLDRAAMPPPPAPSDPLSRRPSLRGKSRTTGNVLRTNQLTNSYSPEDFSHDGYPHDGYGEDPRMARSVGQLPPSRGLPMRRQSVAGSDRSRAYQAYSRGDNVIVQPARSDRRDARRNTMYNMTVPGLGDLDPARRETRGDERSKTKMDKTLGSVEAYLQGMGNASGNPVDNLRKGRNRATSSAPRTRANSNSKASGRDETSSRLSDGARSNSTRKTVTGDGVMIQVNGDDIVFGGDMAGKMIKLRNVEDGDQQIIISDARGRDNRYFADGSRATTNTSSSRSSGRARANSRNTHERDYERREIERREFDPRDLEPSEFDWREPERLDPVERRARRASYDPWRAHEWYPSRA